MNLQKIKEALDIGLSAVLAAGYTRYQENDAEAIREALAEFEKTADVDARECARIAHEECFVDISQTTSTPSRSLIWDIDISSKVIQQYAEAYHQRKCAECKKETAEKTNG